MISIIVPIYNSEKYLYRCLDSILNQSYVDYELILVDDGSVDNSLQICEIYASKDCRIKLIKQKNQGVSVARNSGLKIALGEYITFIDSDDWISETYLESLMGKLSFLDDIVVGGFDCRGLKVIEHVNNFDVVNFLDKEKTIEFFASTNSCLICAKLFKRKILIENNIVFNEKIKHSEDALFCYQYYKFCRVIKIVKSVIYHYNKLNFFSACSRFYNERKEWLEKNLEEMEDLCDSKNFSEEIRKELINTRMMNSIDVCIRDVFKKYKKKSEVKKDIKFVLQYFSKWLNEPIETTEKNIYKKYSRIIKKEKIKNCLKNIILLLTKNTIEKKRDRLNRKCILNCSAYDNQ